MEFFPVYTLDYRGYHLDFYYDDQVFTIWPTGERVDFGEYFTKFPEQAKLLIDQELDTICVDFGKKYSGARLEYFNNGDFRDIRLIYRGRTLKVYLVLSELLVDKEKLIADAAEALKKVFP